MVEKIVEEHGNRLDDHDTKLNKLFNIQDKQGKEVVKHDEKLSNFKEEIKNVKDITLQNMTETRLSIKTIQEILTQMQIQFAVNDKSTKSNEKNMKEAYEKAFDKSQSIATGLMIGIPSIIVSITIIIVTILLRGN